MIALRLIDDGLAKSHQLAPGLFGCRSIVVDIEDISVARNFKEALLCPKTTD